MTATEPRNEKQQFLNAYMVIEGQSVAPMISRLRQVGIVAFDQLGFPVPRDANWKFTNLAPVIQQKNATALWNNTLESLRTGAEMSPLVVANGREDSMMVPAHLSALGFHLLRARTQIRAIGDALLK